MTQQIAIYHNQSEDGVVVRTETNRIEAIALRLSGQKSIFHLNDVTIDSDSNPAVTELVTLFTQSA